MARGGGSGHQALARVGALGTLVARVTLSVELLAGSTGKSSVRASGDTRHLEARPQHGVEPASEEERCPET
jgi:hypothetical protein